MLHSLHTRTRAQGGCTHTRARARANENETSLQLSQSNSPLCAALAPHREPQKWPAWPQIHERGPRCSCLSPSTPSVTSHPPNHSPLRKWPYSSCRASRLTICLFVRRHRDILQSLRPALLLRLTTGQRARGTGSAAPAAAASCSPALPALLIAPFLVMVVLRLLLLAYLGYVVVGVGVSGGAVEGIVAAVVPGLAEHVVGYLQALVPGAGRFQERQRLPPALRHLSLWWCCSAPPLVSFFLPLPLRLQQRASSHDVSACNEAATPSPIFGVNYDSPPALQARMRSPVVGRVWIRGELSASRVLKYCISAPLLWLQRSALGMGTIIDSCGTASGLREQWFLHTERRERE